MGFVSSKIRSTEFIGPLTGTADTASFALTSSFLSGSAETASFALTASYFSGSVETASYALTASYFSGSVETASFALTASYLSGSAETASFALTASYLSGSAETASFALTASFLSGSVETASFALTSSYLSGSAETASFALTASFLSGSAETASYAATASYSDDFKVNNNLIVYGTASFNYLTSIYETASIIYSSGSTKFGDTFDDTHEFTGSVLITGSLEAQNITGSLFGTASFALTASYLSGSAETASFALTASFLSGSVETASYALTASYLSGSAETASFALTASYLSGSAETASFALTASFLSGSATTASFALTASFLSGSITSASFAQTSSRVEHVSNTNEVYVCTNKGEDKIGNGTLLYPYKTINYALTRIGTSSGVRLIIHRGQYAENLNLTATNMHIVGYNSGNGSLVEINGTVTVAASSSSTRISNIRVNALRHTGVGTLFVDQVSCTTSASFGSGYAEVIDSRFECPTGVLHTAGTLLVFGSTFSPLTTSGSTATSYLKDCIGITQPTLTAGSLIIQNCQVTSIVAGTPAINTAANTFLSLVNSQITTATGVPTRIAVGGLLSYDNIVFDKDNSTLGTPSPIIARFQTIDSNIINVSGSLGVSGSINVRNGGITGSLFGTSSFANFAQTASFLSGSVVSASFAQTASFLSGSVETASFALTASYISGSTDTASFALTASYLSGSVETASFALNGGVTQILAGPNITISPLSGKGQVTISTSETGSGNFNTATGSYGSFYDTTTQTNPVASTPNSMSFNETAITNGVSISGSISPFNTYIKTENAGTYNIQFSAQLDKTDSGTDEVIIWLRKNDIDLIDTATSITLVGNSGKQVAAWNWFVQSAANDYYQIIWESADTDVRIYAEPANATPGIPSIIATVNRIDQFLSNTGSFNGDFSGSFSGSLEGNATSASYALTASYLSGSVETASFALTASYFSGSIETASFALTASFLSGSIESASFAATSSFLEHVSNVNEVHVCTNKGEDIIGNGTLLYPYKTISYALTRIGTTPNIRLIIHNGTYVENITINAPDISIISYNGDKESLVTISGDVNTDIPNDKFVRISNIKITRLITFSGNSFFNGINVTSQAELKSTTEITDSKFDCPLGMVHTGGDLYIYRSEISNLTTNRLTFLKDCSNIRHLSISGSSEVDITNCKITRTVGQYAISTSNQTFLTIRNSQIESGINTRGAINIQGAISYEDLIFDKANSILGTTGSLSTLAPTTARFQNIDANLITVTGSLNITGSVNITGTLLGTSSYALTASFLDGFIESASFAETASFALTASFVDGFIESASYSSTSSFAETASYALTASYLSGSISFDSSSFATTGSNTFTGSQVISGSLDISGSLFVNGVNITGDGSNSGGMLLTGSQTLTQQNPFLAITINNTPNNRAVLVDYHLYSTTGSYGARVGTIMSAWSDVDDDVVFNEVTTNDLGNTSEIVFQAGSMNNGDDWFVINTNPTISRTYEVKYSYRLL